MTATTLADERLPAASAAQTLRGWLNYDLAQPLAFAVLALAFVVSRAPFIDIGYGTDPDAWRMALTGYWLWDHHEFYPSRLPGYPVPELAYAAVIKGGWLATNSLTVLVSLAGLWFFAKIAAALELPHRAALVVGFAFTPLLWINSMTTMDYMWALTLILGAYYFLIAGNVFVAALMLGLAIGSRSTSALMVLPFVLYLWRDGKRGEIRPFFVTSASVVILAYAPIAWRYGPAFLNFYDSEVGYLNVLRLLGKDCLGLIGSMAVLAAVAVSLPRLARLPLDAVRDKHVMVWVVAIALTAFSFARLPHEAAYLIPLYPFGFFLMAKYLRQWALVFALSAILLAGFVDLTSPGDEINSDAFTNATLGKGLVLSNRDTMNAQIAFARDLEKQQFEPRTVVMMGFVYPQFAVLNRDRLDVGILEKDKSSISQLSDKGQAVDRARQVTYVWLLDYAGFERFKKDNYRVAYTLDAGRSTAALYNFRPGILGATLIDIGRGPSGSPGAARTDR